jgi:hypothetical protein
MSVKRYEPVERPGPGRWACIKLVESPVGSCVLASDYDALAARVAELEAQAKELEQQRDDAEDALLAWIMEDYGQVALWHLHHAMNQWDDLAVRLHLKAPSLADLTPAPSEPPP